jgi:hypothetical protein
MGTDVFGAGFLLVLLIFLFRQVLSGCDGMEGRTIKIKRNEKEGGPV